MIRTFVGSMAEDSYEGDRDKSGVCLDTFTPFSKFHALFNCIAIAQYYFSIFPAKVGS